MKTLLSTIYAVIVAAVIIFLLYLVAPYVVEYPKIATLILALLMLSSIGAGLRSIIEMGILMPMLKMTKNDTKSFVLCPIIFGLGLLAAIAIPWLNGVSEWGAWQWIASIAFTLFNFETFYAFVGATLRAYNTEDD